MTFSGDPDNLLPEESAEEETEEVVETPAPLWFKILTTVLLSPIVVLLLSLIIWAIVWVWAKIRGVDL